MSKVKSFILSKPKLAQRFMTGMSAEYWEQQGRKQALGTFRRAAAEVPAYRLRFDMSGGVVDVLRQL